MIINHDLCQNQLPGFKPTEENYTYMAPVSVMRNNFDHLNCIQQRLQTPNEDMNQSYLKNWADVADKICFGRT